MVIVWALISFRAAALATSQMRTLPSWQPVASCVAAALNATESTRLGWARFLDGTSAANFQTFAVLSRLPLYRVTLSAAKATSVTPAAWAKVCDGLPKSGEGGCPGLNGTFQVAIDLSSQAAA